MERIETKRLTGSRVQPEDLPDLIRMHTDPVVMDFLGGRVWSVEETRAFLDRLIHQWESTGYGVWILRDRRDQRFVGRAGLLRRAVDGFDETELLYALMPEEWRKGYASEAADGIVRVAFDRLMLRSLVAFTQPPNKASRRVIEKAGFHFERDIIHAGLPHLLYRLRRQPETAEEEAN